ncbi:hypothetical protein [Nonomuraea gerenzanensis]|uniref:hypothetical protein n=1 Tax=Nonomuraea gerenzanensis TaxID=93944 RepID=UPI001CDA4206|nr:hypothetical protein [Nonomuraea gerenzanensis]UBU12913.1 hypothetical protein LCN96_53180 [Nonomuraea gerenzanensis]
MVDYSALNVLLTRRPYVNELRRITRSIERTAKTLAKEYDTQNPSYSPSFSSLVASKRGVPTGYIYADRHEMVNEFGWTDLAGKHHGGRFVFRRALRMHRIKS